MIQPYNAKTAREQLTLTLGSDAADFGGMFAAVPDEPEPFQVTVTVTNDNPTTIYNVLKRKLERDPTPEECKAECIRIMQEPAR